MRYFCLLILLIAYVAMGASDDSPSPIFETAIVDLAAEAEWVNNKFEALNEDERIAQLFMIRAHSDLGPDHIAKVERLIKDYQVGGLCFFQGTPEKQLELTNRYQSLSTKVPLMISMDAEWGLGMRLKKNAISFPRQLMLGAIQDNRLLYDMGKEVARQCRRLGVHVNFAPVVDVNNNPSNPVINTRSFGEDRYNVAVKSYMYMKGMQDGQIMACAKHFPGHGDTDVDSHYDLPIIPHSEYRLDSIELFPFRVLSDHGIESMMVAHLHVPILDSRENRPTTLSRSTVSNLLKEEMGFEGLIFTDGLGMKGVTKHYQPGEVEAEALLAGNDILLLPESVPAAFNTIKQYLKEGKLSQAQIDKSVKSVLKAKYRLGISEFTPLEPTNLRSELNSAEALAIKRKLIENALTLVRDKDNLLPFKNSKDQEIATLAMGSYKHTTFQKTLDLYGKMRHFNTGKELGSSRSQQLISELGQKDVVIISLHDMSSYASKGFGLTSSEKAFIEALRKMTKVVLVVFGNPYSLKHFDQVDYLLEAYDEDEMTQELAAQALFGAFSIRGRLPVTASPKSKFGDGITTNNLFRMGYTLPENVGIDGNRLELGVDRLVEEAMRTKATPGCVVLVAKDGKVVHHKAYGYHTYSKRTKVAKSDIYDLASITKIAATTLSVMKLHEEGQINIYHALSDYLPELKNTNKADLSIYDIMGHRAGLKAWIPFYEQTVTKSRRNPRPMSKYYNKRKTEKYSIQVTDRLFMKETFRESIWEQIYESPLRPTKDYKYSDLGFYLLSELVERVSGQGIEDYVQTTFYQPLGLSTATYNPLNQFSKSRVVPTEEDKYFRRQRVHGYVHDMGAAMLGGISGHAGLFANANDLAIIMQMILNKGYYGGQQFLKPETIRLFTSRHASDTRRGIGFDMKELNRGRSQNMSELASANTFGHLGFTGTCVWSDPEQNLTFIFLSNRTYPSMHNYKLSKEDYRPRIQSIVYQSLSY
ncbi:MAG: glycoside hydrolase family 3 N-terminal domain-containing protein [Bacteroidota bacterium]